MKRYLLIGFIIVIFVFSLQCGGAKSVLTGQVNDNILVIGGILVENLTLSSLGRYETVEVGVEVVVVGKATVNGQEEIKGYELVTDKKGYFFLENVPKGVYVVKGIRVLLEDQSTVRIMSDWDTPSNPQYYQLVRPEDSINFGVTVFPKKQEMVGNVLNIGIDYFGIEPGSVAYKNLQKIENQKLHTEKVHNRLNPYDYYKALFPGVNWF